MLGRSPGPGRGGAYELPTSPPQDLEALRAARGGDHEAGRRLVERHGPPMARTAWSVLGRYGGAEADDVVQEAFIAALTTSALPRGDDVGAWLRAITVRKALDQARRSARRREEPLPTPGEDRDEPVAAGGSSTALDVLRVRRGLAQLAPLDRAVLLLADLEGYSMQEVAQVLGRTRVAVKLRASRARRRLARILGIGPEAGRSARERDHEEG